MKILKLFNRVICTVLATVLALNYIPEPGSNTVSADKGAESAIAWGIDVSAWQGNIDWNAVKAAGVQFAFIKCGGTIYGFDDKFAQNMAGAQAAGIKTGVYIYSYASSVQDGFIEAQWIINAIAPYTINMPVVLDLENYRQKALDPLTNAMICTAFCQTVEAAGYYPMVYSNRSMFRSTIGAFPYDKWVAQWYNYCTDDTAAFWQASDHGSIPGIRGNVDIDYQFKDLSNYIVPNGLVARDGFTYYYVNYRRQSNTFADIGDGNLIYLDPFGHLVAGTLYPVGDFIYYFDATGIMQKGFVNLPDGTRYFDAAGHMVLGWQNILGKKYFFDLNGLMQTGFISDGINVYYLNEYGYAETGMFATATNVYYADAEGRLLTGMQTVNGLTYYFDPALGGALRTGFISDGVNIYHFGVEGHMDTGLFADGNNLYFADAAGRIQTGLVTMSGLSFYFDPAAGGALMVNGTATDALGHVYVSDATGLAVMIR